MDKIRTVPPFVGVPLEPPLLLLPHDATSTEAATLRPIAAKIDCFFMISPIGQFDLF